MHRGAFCQFPFRWIYYYGSNESTGKETGKTYLCAMAISKMSANVQLSMFFRMIEQEQLVWDTLVTIMCRNDELSSTMSWVGKIQNFLSYLQRVAKPFSKFLLFPFS